MPYSDASRQREYQRQWKAQRRAEYTDGVPCAQCGKAENINWHHRDPSDKISHRIWSWSRDRLEAELAKCVALCNGCHTRLHCARSVTHGTHTGYSHYGCRCAACLAAQLAYNRALIARNNRGAGS